MLGKEKNLYFSVMPLNTEHLEEICADIKKQTEQGVSTFPLFIMTLVPEGTPPVDKAGNLTEKFLVFKEKLHSMGIKCGILVQASIGHGYPLNSPSPFKKYVNLNDGKEAHICCPYDDDFCEHFKGVMKTLAAAKPDIIMLDDDFRLIFKEGNGCACDMHLNRFNELAKVNFTREELYEELKSNNKGKLAEIFVETQKESLVKAAKKMREGIDEVNPNLICTFNTSGNYAECPAEICEILAGKGNPKILRIHNGSYVPTGTRLFTQNFFRAALQFEISKGKIDYKIAESDTCPHNRYASNASWIHSHFVGSLLEGANGAIRWMSRMTVYEPESGLAYRKIFAENEGLYEELLKIVPNLIWQGCRIPLATKKIYTFSDCGWNSNDDDADAWSSYVLEKFGLPLYFSSEVGGVTFLSGFVDEKFSNEEILEILKSKVVMTAEIAERLIKRGFGDLIGVAVEDYEGKNPTFEKIFLNSNRCDVQKNSKKMVPLGDNVQILSQVYNNSGDENFHELFPGSVLYENEVGGSVIVFSGTPKAEFNYCEGFAFLTQSRKEQFIHILKNFGALPIYYKGDEEVYLKAADSSDGSLFCALFNLGYDIIDDITLATGKQVKEITMLCGDGTYKKCNFTANEDSVVINEKALPLTPVILFLK